MQNMQTSQQSVSKTDIPVKPLNHNNRSSFMCKMAYAGILMEDLKKMGIKHPFVNKTGRPLYNAQCAFENCKGAHKMENLIPSYQVNQFMPISKAKFDWIKFYFAMKKCIHDNFQKIIKEEFSDLTKNSIENMNFFELLTTWRNLASTHRSKNNLLEKEGKPQIHPKFELPEDLDNFAWSLERITHFCRDHINYLEKVRTGGTMDISELCLGTGMNCKHGVSNQSELLCSKDFLENKCDCPSKQMVKEQVDLLEVTKVQAEEELKNLEEELVKAPTHIVTVRPAIHIRRSRFDFIDDGDEKDPEPVVRTKKVVEQLIYKAKQHIKIIEHDIKMMKQSRMLHFSDFGMIGFNIQLKLHLEAIEKEKQEQEEKQRAFDAMIESAKAVKTVVSLGKLGKKK